MPLDGLFLRCLRGELDQALLGARVDKIHHPAKEELILHMRGRSGTYKLLICANSGRARVGLVKETPENPPQPSMLCMLLRKHLTGAQLTDIRQPGLERLLFFDFAGTSEIGEPTRLCLCVELMGRHSNTILLRAEGEDQYTIIDAVKRMDDTGGALRAMLPGLPYQSPPGQGKRSLLDATMDELQGDPEVLFKQYEGISPLVARERIDDLRLLQKLAMEGGGTPTLLRNANGAPAQFSFLPLCGGENEVYESYSALLEAFYAERDTAERSRQQGAELFKVVQNRVARAARKLEAQRAELAASEDREHLRVCAELILSNRARLEADPSVKGSSGYLLENYYDEMRPLAIPVDPALGPAANAQRYFKEYRKAKTAHQLLGGLIEKGEQELEYLESVLDLLCRAEGRTALEEIRLELEEQGFCKRKVSKKQSKTKTRRQPPLPPLEYRSTADLRILVGRSNTQNDRLSFQIAQGSDIWFHAQGIPGSHVILVTEGREPDESSVEEAAAIALRHSKARLGGAGAVDYTPAKHLKKPKGAPPGKVIYHTYKTLWIQPAK